MMGSPSWFYSRISTLFEVVYAPESAFTRRLDGPSYLIPLLILGLAFALLSFLQAPLSVQWAQAQMQAAGAPPDQVVASSAMMLRSHRWTMAAVPMLLFFKWLLFAAVLWLTCQLRLVNLDYRRVLGIVAYSYFPILFRDATILFILWGRGVESFGQPEALNVAIGLNLLFPHLRLPWSALLGNLNVFELWYVVLLTIGISTRAAVRWQVGLAVILPGWFSALFLQFGLVSLGLALRAGFAQ
jgi:hypothetical protein